MFLSFSSIFISVLPASSALQIAGVPGNDGLIQTSGAGGTIVQYATQNQDGQFFVPGMCIQFWMDCVFFFQNELNLFIVSAEDQSRKREIRLQKNREAARECRRKKKEYIKCLENRVAVLENQNKALIEELKSLKELYCQQKSDWWTYSMNRRKSCLDREELKTQFVLFYVI